MASAAQSPPDHEVPPSLIPTRQLLRAYVKQMLHGCGDSSCGQQLCVTGQVNFGPALRSRKYTPRSARAIALALVTSPTPHSHLCERCHADIVPESDNVAEGPRDPSSLIQLLSDTTLVRSLFDQGRPLPVSVDDKSPALNRLHRSLDPLFEAHSVSRGFLSNKEASQRIGSCLKYLLHSWHESDVDYPVLSAVLDITSRGNAFPAGMIGGLSRIQTSRVTIVLDQLACEPYMRLLARVLHAIALRTRLEEQFQATYRKCGIEPAKYHSSRTIVRLITEYLQNPVNLTTAEHSYRTTLERLSLWLSTFVMRQWDGAALIKRGTPVSGALELHESVVGPYIEAPIFGSGPFTREMPRLAAAWTYAEKTSRAHARHVMAYKWATTATECALLFRTVNHLKMRKEHTASDVAVTTRRETVPNSIDAIWSPGEMRHKELHYLLLCVSRPTILQDAFDEMWQRRTAELHRPLRVRLIEHSGLESGQDLGGVQVEFFNLICKAAFAEDLQMFTSDPDSGMTWFRPMSLQPLYSYEMFGVLFALAVFNGITLPVTFPRAFYELLRHPLAAPPPRAQAHAALETIQDGWPVIAKSLAYLIQTDDPLDLELEWAFPVEANGLRLSFTHHPEDETEVDDDRRRILHVCDVVPDSARPSSSSSSSSPVSVASLETAWPGWRILESITAPRPVKADQVEDYVALYAHFLIYGSVQPQLEAFKKGFHRVLDRHTLSIFKSGADLKRHVEGSAVLDIDALQAAARYDNYDPSSQYITSFWRIISRWPPVKQKQLVKFVTAAERLPLSGAITFIIKRASPPTLDYLPTSSTCFGTLSLPIYPCEQILEEKLNLAINFGLEGFGTG